MHELTSTGGGALPGVQLARAELFGTTPSPKTLTFRQTSSNNACANGSHNRGMLNGRHATPPRTAWSLAVVGSGIAVFTTLGSKLCNPGDRPINGATNVATSVPK